MILSYEMRTIKASLRLCLFKTVGQFAVLRAAFITSKDIFLIKCSASRNLLKDLH